MTNTNNASLLRPSNYDDEAKTTIYVVIRTDIRIEQQVVQAIHAGAEAGRSFYQPEHGIASLVLLAVPDVEALYSLRDRLTSKGVRTELFYEPDFQMGHSALATEPLGQDRRKFLRGLPLWKLDSALAAYQASQASKASVEAEVCA